MKQLLTIYLLLILGISQLWSQTRLKADYYNGTQFNEYVATNYVDNIDFYWNRSPPVPGINPHKCSIRYTGQLKTPKTGVYSFSARVDDGIRVWVDSVLIINNWRLNDVGYSEGKMEMEADTLYSIKIEYFNALKEAELRLLWKLPSDETQSWYAKLWSENGAVVIPAQYFTSSPITKVVEKTEPAPPPVIVAKTKPVPKPKRIAKSKKTNPQPVSQAKKKKVVDSMQRYIPKSVEFNQAQAKILPVSYPELDKLAGFLVKHPTRKVHIEGHTDNVGDMEKNLELSEKRAYAVAAYLVKKGVGAKQLSAKGFGGTKPLVKSSGKEYHPENRRVAFIIQ